MPGFLILAAVGLIGVSAWADGPDFVPGSVMEHGAANGEAVGAPDKALSPETQQAIDAYLESKGIGRNQNLAKVEDTQPRWNFDIEGDLSLGAVIPSGTQTQSGVAMGGASRVRLESPGKKLLIYGELLGEGFNHGDTSKDIQFSRFYLDTGLAYGAKSVKWRTPLNFSISRDTVTNESPTIRYAFSGLYVRFLDETQGEGRLHQKLESISDFVVANIKYMDGWQVPYEPCADPSRGCPPPENVNRASGRTILGLYQSLKYEIEKNGWGSDVQVELLQDLSPGYTKLTGKVQGFKQLTGDLKNLRPYIEVSGALDHDKEDPSGTLQGAVRVFGGIGGRFGSGK